MSRSYTGIRYQVSTAPTSRNMCCGTDLWPGTLSTIFALVEHGGGSAPGDSTVTAEGFFGSLEDGIFRLRLPVAPIEDFVRGILVYFFPWLVNPFPRSAAGLSVCCLLRTVGHERSGKWREVASEMM